MLREVVYTFTGATSFYKNFAFIPIFYYTYDILLTNVQKKKKKLLISLRNINRFKMQHHQEL